MIRLENEEFERSIIDEHYHIAVPVQITAFADGCGNYHYELLVYSFCQKLAEEYEAKFADPTTDEAIGWLAEELFPIMEELDYDSDALLLLSHREFRLTPEEGDRLITPTTEPELLTILTEEDRNSNAQLELDAFEMDGTNPDDAMTVIRENGKIVCFAAVNDIIENDTTGGFDWIELNVECDGRYRCRGYGLSCVVALTRYYLNRGKAVKYLCDEDNTPSIALAEKAGYKLHSRVISMVYYTNEEE